MFGLSTIQLLEKSLIVIFRDYVMNIDEILQVSCDKIWKIDGEIYLQWST